MRPMDIFWAACNIMVKKRMCKINMLITVKKINICMLKYAECNIDGRNNCVLEPTVTRKTSLFGDNRVYHCKYWTYLSRFCLFKIHQHPQQQQCIISSKHFNKEYLILPDCNTKNLSVELWI